MSSDKRRLMFALLIGIPATIFFTLSLFRPVMGNVGSIIDSLLSETCHRLESRSLQFPWGVSGLCSRCTFFWFGLASGAYIFYRRMIQPVFWLGFVLLLPLIIDGSLQYLSSYESTNTLRIITGLSAGMGIALILLGRSRNDLH